MAYYDGLCQEKPQVFSAFDGMPLKLQESLLYLAKMGNKFQPFKRLFA